MPGLAGPHQTMQQAGSDSMWISTGNTEALCNPIGSNEAHATDVSDQTVGIALHTIDAARAICAEDLLSESSREAKALKEDHCIALATMKPPALNHPT